MSATIDAYHARHTYNTCTTASLAVSIVAAGDDAAGTETLLATIQ